MKRLPADADPAFVVESIERLGYACVEGVLDVSSLTTARTELGAMLADAPLGTHEYVGFRTRRAGRLFARTRCLDHAATHPLVRDVLDAIIGHHQLTAPTVIELLPGEVAGPWHHDDCFYPVRRPHPPLVLNTIWAIDDFTEQSRANGVARSQPPLGGGSRTDG